MFWLFGLLVAWVVLVLMTSDGRKERVSKRETAGRNEAPVGFGSLFAVLVGLSFKKVCIHFHWCLCKTCRSFFPKSAKTAKTAYF